MNKTVLLVLSIDLILVGCTSPASPATATVAATATHVQTATAFAPTPTQPAPVPTTANIDDVIEYEMRGAFDFFWEQANTDLSSPGYGLVRDRYPGSEGIASVASVGYALSAYPIGVEKGYITLQQGYDRANGTLDTLLKMDRVEGFYYHYVDMQTGKRAWDSEVSDIDTSILLMGVLAAGEYFGSNVQAKAKQIFDGVNWPWFLDTTDNMFYMAYRPEKDKGFEGHWDFYAEQLILYVLSAGSETHPVDDTPYYSFTRDTANYWEEKPFIHSWFGSIFTYQLSQGWIDFRALTDKEGVNWYDNSVQASLSQYYYSVHMQDKYKTISPMAWGLTACDGPDGYNGLYGAPPSGFDNHQQVIDDTVPPAGAIGSIIFLPEPVQNAMLNYYSIDKLKGKYGFLDAYNLSRHWYDTDVIGIDKGISLLSLANYQNDAVYNIVMKNQFILNGLERLQIKASSR